MSATGAKLLGNVEALPEEHELYHHDEPNRRPNRFAAIQRLDKVMSYTLVDRLRARLHINNELMRAVLAEFFCTGFLLFCGTCVNAQYIISRTRYNEWIGVNIGWGLGLAIAVTMGHRISGAHLNPAVSFFQLTQCKISPIRFILFVVAQNAGAFVGALFTYLVYYDAINTFDSGERFVTGPKATASIFATYPASYLSTFGGVFDQIVGTAILCIGVASITDRRNRIPPFVQPAFIGMLLMLIGMTLGMNAGYAINPARDFGPRLFTLIVGYGWRVFEYREYRWFWVPIIAPMIGAVIGAWIYEIFIGFHIPDDPETTLDLEHDGRTVISSPSKDAINGHDNPVHRIIDDRDMSGDLREVHLVEKRPYEYTEHQQYHPELHQ